MSASGSSRTLLLVALVAAVVVLGASLTYIVTSDAEDDLFAPGEGGAGPEKIESGAGGPRKRGATRAKTGDEEEDPEDAEEDPDGDGIVEWGGSRDPDGPSFDVTGDTLRDVLAKNVWTEVCRQITELERLGRPIPDDVLQTLLGLLSDERRRLDAVMALGLVHDPSTGSALAALAADASRPEELRVAALAALARSGQSAGLADVQRLLDGGDSPVTRQAYLAVAAMGGQDAATSLLRALSTHADDDCTDAVLTALAKLRGGDAALAQTLREARSGGDASKLDLVLRVGTRMGSAAGADLRAEVRTIVESPVALASLESDPEAQLRLRASAIYVASAMGGDALGAVTNLVRSSSGDLRQIALNSLRNAKGDESADRIATLLEPGLDRSARYEIATALGGTASRRATPVLHRLLDDPDGGVREAAAAALSSVRDPESVPVILSRLDGSRGDNAMAQSYVKALGQIGVNDALPRLRALAESDDEFWKALRPQVRNAIGRIETGNPDSSRMR